MPLFLRSLPLSLKTFWRYLILLPFLGILALLLSLLSIVPVLGLLVPAAVSAYLVIAGLRCALAAHDRGDVLDIGRLAAICMTLSLIHI